MDETSYFLANLDPDHIAMPYHWDGSQYLPYGHYGYSDYPSGQIRTSAPQLIKFLSIFMQNMYPDKPPCQGGDPCDSSMGYAGAILPVSGFFQSPSWSGNPKITPRILESETVQLMLRPQIPIINPHIGIVWYTFTSPSERIFWGHDGGDQGVRTQMWYCPEEEIGFVVLSNGEADLYDICTEIFLYGLEQ
jgi:CubicO group peptidase (beta-lactamase class C family)